jgi:hypothetical protein
MIETVDSELMPFALQVLPDLASCQPPVTGLMVDHAGVEVKSTLYAVLAADFRQTDILPDTVIVTHGKGLGFAAGETQETVTHRNTPCYLMISLYTQQAELQAFLAFYFVSCYNPTENEREREDRL